MIVIFSHKMRCCSVLVSGIAVGRIIGWRLGGHAKAFVGPGTHVDQFAALAAERAPRVARAINARATTGRATHGAGFSGGVRRCFGWRSSTCRNRRFFLRTHGNKAGVQAHKVSSNAALSVQACRWQSSICSIKRTDTIRRLPLISGTSPRDGSMYSRSNWKVRPDGRFC